jgi:hypothetical protein
MPESILPSGLSAPSDAGIATLSASVMPALPRQIDTQVTATALTLAISEVWDAHIRLCKARLARQEASVFGGNGEGSRKPHGKGGLAAQQSERTRSARWDCDFPGAVTTRLLSTAVGKDQISQVGLRPFHAIDSGTLLANSCRKGPDQSGGIATWAPSRSSSSDRSRKGPDSPWSPSGMHGCRAIRVRCSAGHSATRCAWRCARWGLRVG